MTLAGRDMGAGGARGCLASAAFAPNGTRLTGEDSSPCTGLEALQPVGR
jgi:hypothetical protein